MKKYDEIFGSPSFTINIYVYIYIKMYIGRLQKFETSSIYNDIFLKTQSNNAILVYLLLIKNYEHFNMISLKLGENRLEISYENSKFFNNKEGNINKSDPRI